jgi:hypothetical protein
MLFTMDKWSAHAPKEWGTHLIRPIPCGGAHFVVTVAGKPYAGFQTRACAEEAVRMWSGETNGCGVVLSLPDRTDAGWPAVRGLPLAILER